MSLGVFQCWATNAVPAVIFSPDIERAKALYRDIRALGSDTATSAVRLCGTTLEWGDKADGAVWDDTEERDAFHVARAVAGDARRWCEVREQNELAITVTP